MGSNSITINFEKVKVTFIKRNGMTFTKSFKSKYTAMRAVRAWKSKRGRVKSIN